MRLSKRIGKKIVAGFLSLVVLSSGSPVLAGNAGVEQKAKKTFEAEYANHSNEVQSSIQINADLDGLAKKVKEQPAKKTPSETVQSLDSTALEYKKQRDESPYRVQRTHEMVSMLSGSVYLRIADLALPGRNGHSFELARIYDSSASQLWEMNTTLNYGSDGSTYYTNRIDETYGQQHYPIGTGWRFDLPYVQDVDGLKYLHFEGGSYFVYDSDPNGMKPQGYIWDDLLFFKDTSVTVGTEKSQYLLKSIRDSKKYYFDYRGNLLEILDANGNAIRFTFWYEGYGYSYGDHLIRIADDIGNEINLSYTATQVIAKQGSKQVTYNKTTVNGDRELLTSVTDQDGRRTVYDYTVRDANFDLVGNGNYASDPYALLSGATHPTGAKSVYNYEGKPVRRNIGGKAWAEVYRISSLEEQLAKSDGTIEVKDRLNATYQGGMGLTNPFSMTLQNAFAQHTYEYLLDSSLMNPTYSQYFYKPTQEVHSSNGVQKSITYSYTDPRKLPLPNETTTVWTVNGVASDPTKISQSYDSYQNVLTKTDALGATTTYGYDPNSHLLQSVTEPVDAAQTRVTEYVRDARSNITQTVVKNQNGTVLRQENNEYDSYGNQAVKRVSDGGRVITTQTEYSPSYQFAFPTKETVSVTDADGVVSTITKGSEYDASTGRLTKLIDGRGYGTSYQYDVLGRLTLQTNPDLSTVSLVYNDLENKIESVDETGNKTYNKWNPLGWKIESGVVSNGAYQALEKWGYDDAGRTSWSEDALAHRTSYTYDGFDRVTETAFADGAKESKQYQDVQHTITTTDPDGNSIRETFDKLEHPVKKELINSTGSQVLEVSTYDYLGNELTKKDANGQLTQYKYDVMQELIGVTDPAGKQTQYAYDMRGNLTQEIYPDGKTLQKYYDDLGRMIKKTDPLGQVEKSYYDANNNVVKQMDRNGQLLTFEYNNRNFLTKKAAGTDVVAFDYDKSGRRTKMVDSTGTTAYVYNALGDLDTVQLQDGKTISYSYDAARNRTKMKDPFGRETFYQLDNRNRVQSLSLDSAANPPEATFTYTNTGHVKEVQQRNGMLSSYAYNDQQHITSLSQKKADGTVPNTYAYEYDANGNQTRKTENGVAYSFTYDGLDRIKTSTQFNETYNYDDRGNRMTLQSDQVPSLTDATYGYDGWNHLAQVTTGDGKVETYKYNGDGLMYERTEGSQTTRYYYDGDQIIAEATISNGTATLKARYTRNGSRLVSREDASGNKAYYLDNAHGDITELRDRTGNVLNVYTYDIWGNPLNATETVENPFRYSGEYWDRTSSLQYLRARWYDPSQARFINEDTFEGKTNSPQSLNHYAYVTNNPLRYIDPTGNMNMDIYETGGGGGFGASSTYVEITLPRSVRNVETNVTRTEFENNLIENGWSRKYSSDGKASIFEKDGARYVVRDNAKTYDGPTAEYYPNGSKYIELKLRLGKI